MQGNPIPTPSSIGAQPADANLTALAALSTTGGIERTGAGTAATFTLTAFGKTLVDDANNTAARTTLGATTVGSNLFTLPNPGAIRFLRLNADNSVSSLSNTDFRTAIDASVSSHAHSANKSTITLTPLNSFAVLSGWENSLTILPDIKLAVISFGLSRATMPGTVTEVFSWSSNYNLGGTARFCPNLVQLNGGSPNDSFFYIAENKLFWNPSNATGSSILVALGGLVFSYA